VIGSVVVAAPAHVLVVERLGGGVVVGDGDAVEPVFEDRRDVTVWARPHAQRALAGSLETRVAVALREPQDSQAGSKALLGMRTLVQDRFTQSARRAADLFGPRNVPRRRPLGVRTVLANRLMSPTAA